MFDAVRNLIPGCERMRTEKLTSIGRFEPSTSVRFRLDIGEEIGLEAHSKQPSWNSDQRGLKKVLNDIFRQRLIKKIKEWEAEKGPDVKGLILICDLNSHDLMNKVVDHMTLKAHGTSCIFHLRDAIPNAITESMTVVYLVDIVNLDQTEYDWLLDDVDKRKSHSSHVLLSYLVDPFDDEGISRLVKLGHVMRLKNLNEPYFLGIFNAISNNVAIIDNCPTVAHVHSKVASTPDISGETALDLSNPDVLITLRVGHRLANLFTNMNEFPVVRYLQSYHPYNKMLSEYLVRQLQEVDTKRREREKRDFLKNYVLVVVDRSMDLITPIVHSQTFQSFVSQELEMLYETDDKQIDSLLENVRFNEVMAELVRLAEASRGTSGAALSEKERERKSSSIKMHTEAAEKMMRKLKDGYTAIVNLEQEMIKGGNQSLKESEKVKSVTALLDMQHKEITSFDVVRLLTIYSVVTKDYTLRTVKGVVKKLVKKGKLTANDVKQIKDYAQIAQGLYKAVKAPEEARATLVQIVADVRANRLALNKFPEVQGETKNLPANVIIFMLGGLSYSELQYAQTESPEVILCSDCLITPRVLFECLGC